MDERFSRCPLWLEYSGLPGYLNQKARGAGWLVFRKIVELDCEQNEDPGIVEISIEDLASRVGLEANVVERVVKKLKREKLIGCFLPESVGEVALLKINVPLKTGVKPEEIKAKHADIFPLGKDFFRYADSRVQDADEEQDSTFKEIIDLYFNAIGLRMNTFILDELRVIRGRFNVESIRKVLARAKRHNIRTLHWVVRELLREQKRDAKNKASNQRE